VEIFGESLGELPARERARFRNDRIGFVFQFHHLLPEFTAEENVAFPHRIAGLSAAESRRRAAEILDRVGLRERSQHRPRALSGGEQQRVAIARAFAAGPQLLLADEPTGNLDGATGRAVIDCLFAEHARLGTALLLITHDAELAARCGREINLADGRIAAERQAAPRRRAL